MVVAICNWTSDVFQPLFLGFEPAATVVEESHTAQTTTRVITAVNIALIMFLQVSLKSSYADLHVGGSLAAIEDHTRCPNFCTKAYVPYVPYVLSSAPGWRHPWRHQCHVNPSLHQHPVVCWRQCHVILLTSSSLTVDHVDFHCWPSHWLWPLTFLHCWLLLSKFSLPSFSHRFHFCCLFLHIVSLNG